MIERMIIKIYIIKHVSLSDDQRRTLQMLTLTTLNVTLFFLIIPDKVNSLIIFSGLQSLILKRGLGKRSFATILEWLIIGASLLPSLFSKVVIISFNVYLRKIHIFVNIEDLKRIFFTNKTKEIGG